jgi:DNA-binding CsgD family transcriptional regulator
VAREKQDRDNGTEAAELRTAAVRTFEMQSLGRRVLIVRVEPGELDLGRLTPAERAVARLVIEGLSNAEIARRRGTLVRTVEKQLYSINRKLGLTSRGDLLAAGTGGGPVRPAPPHPPSRNRVSSPQKGNRGS